MRHRIAVATVSVALIALACSSQTTSPGAQGDGSRLGGRSSEKSGTANKRAHKKSDGGSRSVVGEKERNGESPSIDDPVQSSPDAGGDFAREGPPSPVDPSLARKSSIAEEPEPDGEKEGLAPGYAEILAASIEGLGKDVRFTMTFNGQVPEKTDDDKTFMVIAWAMSMGEDESYGFSARGSNEGWEIFAGAKGESRELPGTFEIDGDSIVIEIPWTFLNGPRAFNWYASSSWFRSIANTTHYIFDSIPNEHAGKFPG